MKQWFPECCFKPPVEAAFMGTGPGVCPSFHVTFMVKTFMIPCFHDFSCPIDNEEGEMSASH